jgi:hypothetical protein
MNEPDNTRFYTAHNNFTKPTENVAVIEILKSFQQITAV